MYQMYRIVGNKQCLQNELERNCIINICITTNDDHLRRDKRTLSHMTFSSILKIWRPFIRTYSATSNVHSLVRVSSGLFRSPTRKEKLHPLLAVPILQLNIFEIPNYLDYLENEYGFCIGLIKIDWFLRLEVVKAPAK